MRVLIVNERGANPDGAPSVRSVNLSKVLNKFGIFTVFLPSKKDLPLVLVGRSKIKKYLRRLYLIYKIRQNVKKHRIDAIISRGFYMGLVAVALAKIYKFKTIFDFHGFVWQEEVYRGLKVKPFFTKLLEELCIRKSDIIITQNENNKKVVKKLNSNVILVKNGIDLKVFENSNISREILENYSIPISKPKVGFVGNWEAWVNIKDLLVSSEYLQDVAIIVIGQGKGFEEYKEKYKNVIFTGRIPYRDVVSLLMSFDICVAPYSKDEIMKYKSAMKTLEYLAAGKPIIVSNVVGKEDFLVEGIHCLTYMPENPQDLAQKIKFLLNNPGLLKSMGENNRKLARSFTWEKNILNSGLIDFLKKAED